MQRTARFGTTSALLAAALLTFTACTTDQPPPAKPAAAPPQTPTPAVERTSGGHVEPGVPGGTAVETIKFTANVTYIDAPSRTLTLLTPDGTKTAVKCGPEVVNFDQIKVGDQLKVVATEELAVYMATGDPPPAAGAVGVALAPRGAKPGGIVAGTMQVTATVTAIDLPNHKATLQFPDGTKHVVAVRPDVDLTQRKVGEKVVIRVTESVAISVDKP